MLVDRRQVFGEDLPILLPSVHGPRYCFKRYWQTEECWVVWPISVRQLTIFSSCSLYTETRHLVSIKQLKYFDEHIQQFVSWERFPYFDGFSYSPCYWLRWRITPLDETVLEMTNYWLKIRITQIMVKLDFEKLNKEEMSQFSCTPYVVITYHVVCQKTIDE